MGGQAAAPRASGHTASSHRLHLLIVLLAPLFAGCFATSSAPLRRNTDFTRATGVTMRSGEQIEFLVEGATIENDTLHAVGDHVSIAIPTDSIAKVSVHKFSWRNTTGVAVGVGAVSFLVLLVLAYRNFGNIN
jgi:hypothetical protein